ncbi:MAG: DUF4436 domain-containing protein [Actinomycetales bacterium]|nr:DUF4436 domain-containing protein [Actinomycetales bacterium]
MSPTAAPFIPEPRRVSRRGWIIAAVVATIVAILYGTVVRYYDVEGGLDFQGNPTTNPDGILVRVGPANVDAAFRVATLHFAFEPGENLVDDRGVLLSNVRLTISSWSGAREVRYQAGEVMRDINDDVGINGEQALYPLDKHEAAVFVTADTYVKDSGGGFTSTGLVPTSISGDSSTVSPPGGSGQTDWGLTGWDTRMVGYDTAAGSSLSVVFTRAFSTKIFAGVLLLLAMILSAFALTVGLLTVTRRRRVEVGLMTYAGAVLFALPALRQYMPNAPPIGAAIDVFVYLWVMIAAIAAVTLIVSSWIAQSRTALLYERRAAEAAAASASTEMSGD